QTIVHRWMEEAFVRDRWHWEPGANMLARPPFPARRRVVAHYLERDAYDYLVRNTSYVVLTDETEDDDPPLFELRVGTPQRYWLPERCLAHITRALVEAAFRGTDAPALAPDPSSARPFAVLFPSYYEIAEGVYCRAKTERELAFRARHSAHFVRLRDYYRYAIT